MDSQILAAAHVGGRRIGKHFFPLQGFIIPRHEVEGGYRNGCRLSVRPSVLPSVRPFVLPSVRPARFVSGAEHKNRERYLNQTWYIDRSSGELVPFDSLGFLNFYFYFF